MLPIHFAGIPTMQRGAALVIALVFLVALTVLGLAAMGGNTLQQKMAYSVGENNLAFQSAESGLSAGESWLESRMEQPAADCTAPCGTATSIWPGRPVGTSPEVNLANLRDSAWWNTRGRKFGFTYEDVAGETEVLDQRYSLGGVPLDLTVAADAKRYPRYVIEELGKDPSGSVVVGGPKLYTLWYYQLSARGTGAQPLPATVVQSVYTKGF